MSTVSAFPGIAADGQTLQAAAMLGMNEAVRSHMLLQSHLTVSKDLIDADLSMVNYT